MNISLIKNEVCENVAVFESVEQAQELLGSIYEVIAVCPIGRGISHRYINDTWYNPQPTKDSEGVFPYVSDMCVVTGDLVYGSEGKVYEALDDIQFQQLPPEALPTLYIASMLSGKL